MKSFFYGERIHFNELLLQSYFLYAIYSMNSFYTTLRTDLDQFVSQQITKYPADELLKIDLHCHDHYSDVPDELMGRILNLPETYLPTQRLLEELRKNGCDAITITNHNNARSCFELLDTGEDVLVAAEFSCFVPDYGIGIHVLTYGFSREQELVLNKLRKNIYKFQEYTCEQNIPTIWAHPLYHYASKELPPMEFFEKMTLLFERFEVLNGQRDTWQNLLVKEWLLDLTEQKMDAYARKYDINPALYCKNVYQKAFTGGSDSHMGIFAGLTGSYVHVPNLQQRLQSESKSQLILEAIREKRIVCYGSFQNSEKLTISLLSYVAQVALNYKDPGLLRILLHKGSTQDKVVALILSNLFLEIKNHKATISFLQLFQEAIMGQKPNYFKKLTVPSSYKPIFEEAVAISRIPQSIGADVVNLYRQSIENISNSLTTLFFKRLSKKMGDSHFLANPIETFEALIDKLEMPSGVRSYMGSGSETRESAIDLKKFLDGLSFPFLSSALMLSAHFASSKAMYNTRPFLNQFSQRLGKFEHPKRAIWLTDTFDDKNGVSTVLRSILKEIQQRDLPIDIVVCSDSVEPDNHLIVLKPLFKTEIPVYHTQEIRVPDFLELHNLFYQGAYDRIICSTEGIMGFMSLYLKSAYSVKASFYIHTDWVMFGRKVLGLQSHDENRMRRLLRAFYHGFDQLFVLNGDQQKWLTGNAMNIPSEAVSLTAHWVDDLFKPQKSDKQKAFGIDQDIPVLLYVGRVSAEKGVMEFPEILRNVQQTLPKTQLVLVGQGPLVGELKQLIPDAIFIDWVSQNQLPLIYASADLFVFPSKFDTFSCVVLEAISCGLPVVAYKTKGPKEIIANSGCGEVVMSKAEMIQVIITYLNDDICQTHYRQAALRRRYDFTVDNILTSFLQAVGL